MSTEHETTRIVRSWLEEGATTIPDTPVLSMSSTTAICEAESSSLSGPFQMISQPISCAALLAPAWIDFQNSCVVPLGMTAMVLVPPEAAGAPDDPDACVEAVPPEGVEELLSQPASTATSEHTTSSARCFIAILCWS